MSLFLEINFKSDCWAFAAVGALEAAIFKTSNKLVTLSPQLLTDCDKNNNACNGGISFFGIKSNKF